jgi:hypothetical protein
VRQDYPAYPPFLAPSAAIMPLRFAVGLVAGFLGFFGIDLFGIHNYWTKSRFFARSKSERSETCIVSAVTIVTIVTIGSP